MKVVKYLFRFVLFLFIGIALAAIVIPIVFKDDIVAGLKTAINDNINAEVDFAEVDLSIISTFPNAGIQVSNIAISGIGPFEGIPLANIGNATVEVSLPSIFNDETPLEVREVSIKDANLNILIKKNGAANYDIIKPTEAAEQEGDFILKLSKYELVNSSLRYTDRSTKQEVTIEKIYHSGSGSFFNDVFDLDTKTDISGLTVVSDGTAFLSKATAKADVKLGVDLGTNTYTLKENKLSINAMDVNLDGKVQMKETEMLMDFTFSAPSEDAKGIMSILPGIYSKDFADAKATGTASLSGYAKGRYNSDRGILPAIKLDMEIKEGGLQYPALPKALSNINTEIHVQAKEGDYSDMVINIPALSLNLGENTISGSLETSNLSTDPSISGKLKGDIVLEDWKSALPLEDVEQLSGSIQTDVVFAGKQSDIANENYSNLKLAGTLTGSNIAYKVKDQPEIAVGSVTSEMSPASIAIKTTNVKAGKTTADAVVQIDNPLAYLVQEGTMQTSLQVSADQVDANEWMTAEETTDAPTTVIPAALANVTVDMKIQKLTYETYEVNSLQLKGDHKDNGMELTDFSGTMGKSDFALSGRLDNTLGYFNNNENLQGDLTLQSTNLHMEDFLESDPDVAVEAEVVPVPENLDLTIHSNIKTATYDKIVLQDVKGDVVVKNQEALLKNGTSKGLGGTLKFEGLYGTPPGEKPDFAFKYDLSNLDFEQTFASVEITQKLAPIMKYIQGYFNSTLVMDGKLGNDMFPDLNTVNASGFLETLSGQLQKIDVANKLADKLGIEALRKLDLDHTKNWFEIVDGMVELKPFEHKFAGIDMAISGKHGLGSSMAYQIIMDIPREMLKGNVVTGIAEKGLSFLEREAGKLGVNIDQGDFIKIRADLTGSLTNPGVKLTPLGSGGKATMKDVAQQQLDDLKKTVKDSVNTVIKDTKAAVRDTVNSTIKTAKDSVKTVVNQKVETAKDSAKTVITTAVNDQIDKVLKDSVAIGVKDKLDDVINSSTEGAADEIKDKLDTWNPFKKKKKKDK